jgi:hypothetical protein
MEGEAGFADDGPFESLGLKIDAGALQEAIERRK